MTVNSIAIQAETPDQPDVIALIEALDAYAMSLYPPSNHLLDVTSLCEPSVRFLVARAGGRAVGCGALMPDARGWGEIKRMYVRPDQRGRGVGWQVLAGLEAAARDGDLPLLCLETGIRNFEALTLYRRSGFAECAAFGDYAPDPLSVFRQKRVSV